MTCGIVLSGGASSRMGQPKALLELGGIGMAERLFKLFSEFCDPVWIVTGAQHDRIASALPQYSPQLVWNVSHAEGMLSSLRTGLAQCGQASSVLFSPVDFAGVQRSTIQALFAVEQQAVVKPRWRGQSGHPVLIRTPAIQALNQARPGENAKAVLSRFEATYVDVEDRAVAEDCDTPDDYEKLLSWWHESA